MSSTLDKPNFSREHRLGLVVYGGIALAIYMNGICQEFYNAVRGRGIYKLIKALTDADIVVDVISGTSAGGINGVLLSYALANSQGKNWIKFEEFAEVWKNSGDIHELLFNKEYYGIEKSSFFNGVGYYKSEIKKALIDRRKDLRENAPEDDWFSELRELDLFITGTDILGKVNQVFDNTGCLIDVKDHHAIFHLKYRDYKDNPFNPDDITCEALAKLCQITSCFPVAFPPVTVKLEPTDNDPDKKLVEWGSLTNRIVPHKKPKKDKSRSSNQQNNKKLGEIDDDPGKGYRLHFVDGGVLDNRPFSYTIKEIYHRTAERPVFRKLFYVDPSPERFKDNSKYKDMLKPDVVQVVQDSLLAMPRYESINNDLELINEHNEKVRRYNFLRVDLEALLDTEEKDRENNDYYDQQRNVYLRTRLISLEDKILPLIFLKSEGLIKPTKREENREKEEYRIKKLEKVAKLLAEPFTDPEGSSERLKLLEQLEEEIKNLDVDYALRRYFFITEYMYRLLDEEYLYEWLKNKKKQEIDERIKKEKIDNNSAENKKKEIDNISINKKILSNIEALIKEINYHRKLVEVIKDKLDKLFIYDGIEKYFLGLLDPHKVPEKQFTEKFYRAMLWLHGQFLKVELPSDLKNKELSEKQLVDTVKQLADILDKNSQRLKYPQDELDKFFKKSDKEQLSELSKLTGESILDKLVNKTKEHINESSNRTGEIDNYNYIKEKLCTYFRDFEKLDTVLYPLDYLAGTPEKQLIETFRISPEDAKLGLSSKFEDGERLDKKLAGDSLNAFGGFLKKSWRANDILWGRLDGLNRIVDALVTEEKIKNFPKFIESEAKKEAQKKKEIITEDDNDYLDRYLDCLLEDALFSNFRKCSETDKQYLADKQYLMSQKDELKEKLKKLFPSLDGQSPDEQALKKEYLQDFVNSLVSVGHLLILDQELDKTMEVSIEEQLDWKQQKQPINIPQVSLFKWSIEEDAYSLMRYLSSKMTKAKPEPNVSSIPKFHPIDCSFDSAITALVVKKVAKESLASMSLKEKEEFFNKKYKIGLETLDHIPKSELKQLILRGILIFQDIFKTWQHKIKLRSNGLSYSRLDFWNRLGLKLVGWSVNIAIWVIKNILLRRF